MLVRRKFTFLFLLVLGALVFGLVQGIEGSQARATEGQDGSEVPEGVEAYPTREEPERVRELVGARDATSKTYELVTGQLEWVSNGDVIHYKDAQGRWQDVANSLVADSKKLDGVAYGYRNSANSYTARFGAKAGGAHMVYVEFEGKSVSFGPVAAKPSEAAVDANPSSSALSYLTVAENCVTYPELYPGVDFIYEPTGSGVREFVVLHDSDVQNEFTFNLWLDGVQVKDSEGRISFVDEDGEEVFYLGRPFAMDGAFSSTDEVTCVLGGKGNNLQLVVTLSRDYLEDPSREFPVVLDPDLMISGEDIAMDTCVDSGDNPGVPNDSENHFLRTGYLAGETEKRRSLIQFDLPHIHPDLLDGGYIMLRQCYGDNPVMHAYPIAEAWHEDYVTWNNQPDLHPGYFSSPNYWAGTGWWWKMYHTTPIKKWLSGEWPNYGWMIIDPNGENRNPERASWFYSYDAGSPYRPELHLTYHYAQVDVRVVCDLAFQIQKAPSWCTYAYDQFERIDNKMALEFGINFNVETPLSWVSPMDGCSYSSCCYEHWYSSGVYIGAMPTRSR